MDLRAAARSPAVWRGLISIVGAIVILLWPEVVAQFLVAIIGIGLIAVGSIEIVAWARERPRRPWELVRSTVLVAGGVLIFFAPTEPVDLVKVGIAVIIGLRAVLGILTAYRAWRREEEDPFWPLLRGVLSLGLALTLVLIPGLVVTFVVLIVAFAWIISGFVVLLNAVGDIDAESPTDLIGVLKERSMEPDLRDEVTGAIFEGLDTRDGTVRFVALMAFATAIATFGIEADSTAVVIGAMLIAPLMSPIMALSAGILMNWFDRAVRALRRVVFGVSIAIFVSYVMAIVSPEIVSIATNSQVLSRTSPTLLDLLVALAAGGAGGYALSHPQVGNSLPGVAIAVALVPPLAVVGVSIQATEWSFAVGAFLLFFTNLVGIVIAAGATFVLSGYSPWSKVGETGEAGRRSFGLVGIALLLVSIPLAVTGNQILAELEDNSTATSIVTNWLDDQVEGNLVSVNVAGSTVSAVVVAGDDVAGVQELADELAAGLDREVEITVRVIPEQVHEATSG